MIVYIAGPMTGIKNYNHEAFAMETQKQEIFGHVVLSPHKLPIGLSYDAYMDIAMAKLRSSDSVHMLPGWKQSKGATFEHHYAKLLNKPITGASE
jgi:hypothetical protein